MSGGRDVVAVPTATAAPPLAGRQVIVTIGIDRYRDWRRLTNAVGDATGATAVFQQLGFVEVRPPLLDDAATGRAINALVNDELDAMLGPDDSLVVFYAGHGGTRTQTVGDHEVTTGYLIPVDAADNQGVTSWIEIDAWLRKISRLKPRHILVIVDACYSGIALTGVKWGRDSGLLTPLPFAATNAKRSRVVLTSASADEIAMDNGPRPGHSLFTGCLIEALTGGAPRVGEHRGRPVTLGSEIGNYVRRRVQSYDGRPGWKQTPDLGTFDFDARGEMLIPLLVDEPLAPFTVPVRSSAEQVAELAALTMTGLTLARPPVAPPRRRGRWIAAIAVAIAVVGAAIAVVVRDPDSDASRRPSVVVPSLAPPAPALPSSSTLSTTIDPSELFAQSLWALPEPRSASSLAAPPLDPGRAPPVDGARPARRAASLRGAVPRSVVSTSECGVQLNGPKGVVVVWANKTATIPTFLPGRCGTEIEFELRRGADRWMKKEVAMENGKPKSYRLKKSANPATRDRALDTP